MKIYKNPFFYLTIVLTGLLVWQVAGFVQAQSNYTGPSGSPTAGMPATPLDTSATAQTKTGELTIGGLTSTGNVTILGSSGTGGVRLFGNGNGIQFTNTGGTAIAGLRFNISSSKLEFSHNGSTWQDIGTGGGIGWQASGNDIANTNTGRVTVNSDFSVGGKLQSYTFVPTNLSPYVSYGSCDASTGTGTDAADCAGGYVQTGQTTKTCTQGGGQIEPAARSNGNEYEGLLNVVFAATTNYVDSRECSPASPGSYSYLDRFIFNSGATKVAVDLKDRNDVGIPPRGAWCGLWNSDGSIFDCAGQQVFTCSRVGSLTACRDNCPAGYTRVSFGNSQFGSDWHTCVKQ